MTPTEKKLCEGLIHDAAFQIEQLSLLRAFIAENGWSESYKNGANQFGRKHSVEAECYLKLSKQYLATIKALADIVPTGAKAEEAKAGEELMRFLAKGKPI